MKIVGLPTPVFCGVDWAEDHHDIALVDAGGKQLAKVRISDDAAGFAPLAALFAEHGDSDDAPIPGAIETSRGLLVACLRATGRPVRHGDRPCEELSMPQTAATAPFAPMTP